MVSDTTKQKRNVTQVSVFVLPEQKRQIVEAAERDHRPVSNFCANLILGKINPQVKETAA